MSDSFATSWSLPGSSVHGILQAGILEWIAIFFSESKGIHISIVYQLCFLFVKQEKQILTKKQKRHLCGDYGVTHRTERKVKKVDSEHAEIVKFEQKRVLSSRIDGCYLSRKNQLQQSFCHFVQKSDSCEKSYKRAVLGWGWARHLDWPRTDGSSLG